MQYRGKRDIRQIGGALGVSHVLEGSVRKTGARLYMKAQLIDTRTGAPVWTEEYDRGLNDVFAVQSEIAQEVAQQLRANISTTEKLAIQQPPTADLTAFDLYTRAKNLLLLRISNAMKANLLRAADLLNQAAARDSSFLQAYCELAYAHDMLYFLGFDHTPARLALAEAAIQRALRLRPDSGETQLAHARDLYHGHLDHGGALAELKVARQTLPNDARIFQFMGYIQRRQGRWEESMQNLERAVDLDPRNTETLQQIAISYGVLRRYAEDKAVLDRALTVDPNDIITKVALAAVQFQSKADTAPLHQPIDPIRHTDPAALPNLAQDCPSYPLPDRDIPGARNALDAFGDMPLTDYAVHLNRPLIEGVLARMTKRDDEARAAFTAARTEQEKIVWAQPGYGPALCVLGLIDAALGR